MTLDEVLAYIHKVDWRGSVPGLSRIDTLLGLLGHPERHVKYVHVTGTNGKGSTCAMLASVLRAAGYKTGLYTSPYISASMNVCRSTAHLSRTIPCAPWWRSFARWPAAWRIPHGV